MNREQAKEAIARQLYWYPNPPYFSQELRNLSLKYADSILKMLDKEGLLKKGEE